MPRVLGVDIPADKRVFHALQYIYGVGPSVATDVCFQLGLDLNRKARQLTEDEIARLGVLLDREFVVEGQLRRFIQQSVTRLKDIACYRGVRHRRSLPVRGQRTRTNARTRKGVKKTVAGKKGVKDMKH